jgi:peroxiredoxin
MTVLLAGAVWTLFARVPNSTDAGQIPSPREGFPAPNFTLEDLNGSSVALSDYRGQVVIVNLWASWCLPCRAEMPEIRDVYAANRDRGLVVLAVNSTIQDDEVEARAFVQEFGLTFPVLLDREDLVGRRYRLRALPTTFFIDRRGIIRTVIVGGPMSRATLQTKVEDLLHESP